MINEDLQSKCHATGITGTGRKLFDWRGWDVAVAVAILTEKHRWGRLYGLKHLSDMKCAILIQRRWVRTSVRSNLVVACRIQLKIACSYQVSLYLLSNVSFLSLI